MSIMGKSNLILSFGLVLVVASISAFKLSGNLNEVNKGLERMKIEKRDVSEPIKLISKMELNDCTKKENPKSCLEKFSKNISELYISDTDNNERKLKEKITPVRLISIIKSGCNTDEISKSCLKKVLSSNNTLDDANGTYKGNNVPLENKAIGQRRKRDCRIQGNTEICENRFSSKIIPTEYGSKKVLSSNNTLDDANGTYKGNNVPLENKAIGQRRKRDCRIQGNTEICESRFSSKIIRTEYGSKKVSNDGFLDDDRNKNNSKKSNCTKKDKSGHCVETTNEKSNPNSKETKRSKIIRNPTFPFPEPSLKLEIPFPRTEQISDFINSISAIIPKFSFNTPPSKLEFPNLNENQIPSVFDKFPNPSYEISNSFPQTFNEVLEPDYNSQLYPMTKFPNLNENQIPSVFDKFSNPSYEIPNSFPQKFNEILQPDYNSQLYPMTKFPNFNENQIPSLLDNFTNLSFEIPNSFPQTFHEVIEPEYNSQLYSPMTKFSNFNENQIPSLFNNFTNPSFEIPNSFPQTFNEFIEPEYNSQLYPMTKIPNFNENQIPIFSNDFLNPSYEIPNSYPQTFNDVILEPDNDQKHYQSLLKNWDWTPNVPRLSKPDPNYENSINYQKYAQYSSPIVKSNFSYNYEKSSYKPYVSAHTRVSTGPITSIRSYAYIP